MSWKSIAHSNILINIDIWPTKFVIFTFWFCVCVCVCVCVFKNLLIQAQLHTRKYITENFILQDLANIFLTCHRIITSLLLMQLLLQEIIIILGVSSTSSSESEILTWFRHLPGLYISWLLAGLHERHKNHRAKPKSVTHHSEMQPNVSKGQAHSRPEMGDVITSLTGPRFSSVVFVPLVQTCKKSANIQTW